MNYKTKLILLILLLSCLSGVIYFTKMFSSLGSFAFLFSLSTGAICVILLFSREEVFHSWKKFFPWWLLGSAFVVFITPNTYTGIVGFDQKNTSFLLAVLFFFISFILIVYKSIKLRGK